MSLPIRFLAEARTEFDHASNWYDHERAGWGAVFTQRVRDTLDRIASQPYLHATVYKDARQTTVKRFPYLVVYRILGKELIVVAVFHTSRDPAVWQQRI